MSAPLVEAVDLGLSFPGPGSPVRAVRSATCSLFAGQAIAVTGPSGSGKSSLLHLLGGLERPTSGTVCWPGLDAAPTERPELIGVVFQAPSLLAPLTVAENVALPLRLLARPLPADAIEAAVSSALRAVDLADLADRLPDELSGGQAQRASVARVIAQRPRIVLADEPTGKVGSQHALAIVDALIAAARHAASGLLLATHDEDLAARLPERWRMTDGVLADPAAQPDDRRGPQATPADAGRPGAGHR